MSTQLKSEAGGAAQVSARRALVGAVTSVMANMKSLLPPTGKLPTTGGVYSAFRHAFPHGRPSAKHAGIAALVFAAGLVGADPWHASNAPSGGFRPLIASADARDVSFANPRVAFDQGLGAYRNGYYEIAIPAFEFVVARNDPNLRMFAEFYLARLSLIHISEPTRPY